MVFVSYLLDAGILCFILTIVTVNWPRAGGWLLLLVGSIFTSIIMVWIGSQSACTYLETIARRIPGQRVPRTYRSSPAANPLGKLPPRLPLRARTITAATNPSLPAKTSEGEPPLH